MTAWLDCLLQVKTSYTIAIICTSSLEFEAMLAVLDETESETLNLAYLKVYAFGRIGKHNVAVVCLPPGPDGVVAAASFVKDLQQLHADMSAVALVGIGRGLRDATGADTDVRRGDVVVSGGSSLDQKALAVELKLDRFSVLPPSDVWWLEGIAKLKPKGLLMHSRLAKKVKFSAPSQAVSQVA